MKTIATILLGLSLCAPVRAQTTTTTTDCSSQKVGNTITTDCQSTTTSPPPASDTKNQPGQQIGQSIANLGNGIGLSHPFE
jgi:hypothetical protein